MQSCRVLVISTQPLFREAIGHLLQSESHVEIVGQVDTLQEAYLRIEDYRPHALIVDYTDAPLPVRELDSFVSQQAYSLRVIFLTLENNEMLVHNWQRVHNVSARELSQALMGVGKEEVEDRGEKMEDGEEKG